MQKSRRVLMKRSLLDCMFGALGLLYDTSHKARPGATGGYAGTDLVNKLYRSEIALPLLILVYRHGGRPSNTPSRMALEVTLLLPRPPPSSLFPSFATRNEIVSI